MTGFVSVHITASSPAEAGKIGRVLVEERLAACVNIVEGAHSIYRWQGNIEEAVETILIVKTRTELFGALRARVKALHSYVTPCIVAMPITAGDPDYLDWIAAETAKGTQ